METSKKIDQDFVLSDSSVNVYGFRLLTEGCVLSEVQKNPIGYYGHDRDGGVLLRWEDVRVAGDQILGKPVVNLMHERGARTVSEIEAGFLNAASVGSIVLLEHELEDNANGGDPILVGTKWYYKECSVVDSPGNRNAFKAELFDANDVAINLSDLTKDFVNDKIKTSDMKEIQLKITPQLVTLLSLSDEPDAKEIGKSIKDLHERATAGDKAVTENTGLTKELKDLKDDVVSKEVAALLQKGLDDKKLSVALKDKLATDYAINPKGLKSLIDAMTPYEGIVTRIENATEKKNVADLKDKSWDELDKDDKLQDLKDNDMDTFKLKFKAKFKKEYEGK